MQQELRKYTIITSSSVKGRGVVRSSSQFLPYTYVHMTVPFRSKLKSSLPDFEM